MIKGHQERGWKGRGGGKGPGPEWGRLPPTPYAQFEGGRNVVAFGGERVLHYFDLQHVSKWAWLGWECLFFLAFLALTLLALTLVRHQRR